MDIESQTRQIVLSSNMTAKAIIVFAAVFKEIGLAAITAYKSENEKNRRSSY